MANDALQYLLPYLLSTDSQVESSLLLYPNPTETGFIKIKSSFEDTLAITIFDLLGKKVREFSTLSNTLTDLSKLESGIYFVTLKHHNKVTTKKLIIKL